MKREIDFRLRPCGLRLSVSLAEEDEQQPSWDMLTAKPEVVEAWQDMRFGMFNCWGPVSLTGLEIGWSRGAPRGGEFRVREGQGPTPVDVYDNLYKQMEARQVRRSRVGRNRQGRRHEVHDLPGQAP